MLRLLAISDEVDPRLYGADLRARFGPVDLVLSCGDLPAYYLDYVATALDAPLHGVHGNHDEVPHDPSRLERFELASLHGRVVYEQGLLIGGIDGSMRYNRGAHQYSESEMRRVVAGMLPRLLANRARYGRALDILVTHAPPQGIHDGPDLCHRGFGAFRWLLKTFRPRYHLHGHMHVFNAQDTPTHSRFEATEVINVYPYRALRIEVPVSRSAAC